MQPLVAHRIERDILIEAPVEVVWAVVTQPEHISGWFSESVEIDLTPGGKLALHWDSHGTRHGRVERVEPPHFLSFRWAIDPDQDLTDGNSTLVEFSLTAEGDATRLTVVETGFDALDVPEDTQREHFDGHTRGWDYEFGQLLEYVAREGLG
jgi:uncharacterized protein YndB with AHSA1/START domain